jgi:hypothetical protein
MWTSARPLLVLAEEFGGARLRYQGLRRIRGTDCKDSTLLCSRPVIVATGTQRNEHDFFPVLKIDGTSALKAAVGLEVHASGPSLHRLRSVFLA